MSSCCNVKGFVTAFNQNNGTAQVKGEDGVLYENVFLITPYGTNSIPEVTDNTEIMLWKSMGSNSATYGLVFNYIKTQNNLPIQNENDYAIGNLTGKNSVIYKQDGTTIEKAKTKEIKANVDIDGNFTANGTINLGDATALILNQNAVLTVTITTGSSAGTYPVTIQSAGQTKVKA